jgi:hypothetical protein
MTATDTDRPESTESAGDVLRIDVVRGNPTPEEIAAVIAVVSDAYATESATAVAPERRRRSAWELSTRTLRQPLRRDVGWGAFSG